MGYYDYSTYFVNLINKSEILHQDFQQIILYLQLFIFLFGCFFVYYLVSKMLLFCFSILFGLILFNSSSLWAYSDNDPLSWQTVSPRCIN